MSKTAWTPGKWTVGAHPFGSYWISMGDPMNGPHEQFTLRTTEANARLIAAAPELYESLDRLIGAYRELWEDTQPLDVESEKPFAMAAEALAKARGEQQ